MTDFILPLDQSVSIPLDFSDSGGPVNPPATGASVTSSNPGVVTATVAANDGSVVLVPVSAGTGVSILYANTSETPNLSATLIVDVVAPSPTAVAFDTTDAVFTPLASATPAPAVTPAPAPAPAVTPAPAPAVVSPPPIAPDTSTEFPS